MWSQGFCSLTITQDIKKMAEQQEGLKAKSEEFVQGGGKIYVDAAE